MGIFVVNRLARLAEMAKSGFKEQTLFPVYKVKSDEGGGGTLDVNLWPSHHYYIRVCAHACTRTHTK